MRNCFSNFFDPFLGIIAAVALLLLQPFAFGETIAPIPSRTLILRETAEATADTLLLKDLVAVSDSATANSEESFQDVVVGLAPTLGKETLFQRSDLEGILRRSNPQGSWKWQGAQQCKVSRPALTISEEQATELIETALRSYSNKEGEVHVIKLLNFSPLLAPKKGSYTEVELVSPNSNSSFGSASLHVEHDGRSFCRRNVRFEWEWKRSLWVARENQSSGQIKPESFVTQLFNVLGVAGEPLMTDSLPSDLLLIRPVAKGEPLVRTNLKAPLAIARGSAITANIRAGPLLVSLRAIALENGSLGQTIRLQNTDSRKEIFGKVIRENEVEVIP